MDDADVAAIKFRSRLAAMAELKQLIQAASHSLSVLDRNEIPVTDLTRLVLSYHERIAILTALDEIERGALGRGRPVR
jgi:hypothetical protein